MKNRLASHLTIFLLVSIGSLSSAWGRPLALPEIPEPGGRFSQLPVLAPALGDAVLLGVFTYFGGTTWDAVDGRWEALPDSVWTFDTGVGSSFAHTDTCKSSSYHAAMEGWVGIDRTYNDTARFRRLGLGDFSGAACVGTDAGLGGSYSLWAGRTQAEAEGLCWSAGRGYGNNWLVSVTREYAYDGTDSLVVEFDYTTELEDGFDFVNVILDTVGTGELSTQTQIASYTGAGSGSASLILTQALELPSAAGSIYLRFEMESDGAWSDEDSLFTTDCGAFAVDNIRVRNTEYGGGLDHLSDFESDDDGWVESATECGAGDFSRLMALADLPPQAPGACNLADSVLVFFDPGINGYDDDASFVALSPWIDLDAEGFSGGNVHGVEFERSAFLPFTQGVGIQAVVQFYPDTCAAGGGQTASPLIAHPSFYLSETDTCQTSFIDLSNEIPAHAERVRIGLGVISFCQFFYPQFCGTENLSPWIDNVRLVVSDFTTIQAAIDAASPGDTVYVPPGKYAGPGNVNLDFGGKNIVLCAPFGPTQTEISCAFADRGFVFQSGEDSSSVVEGLRVRSGSAPVGGGAWITNGSHPTFKNCDFISCSADTGAGLMVDPGSSVRLEDCLVASNGTGYPVQAGGGIYIAGPPVVPSTIRDSQIQHNDAVDEGGGLWAVGVRVEGTVFNANTADSGGGAYVEDALFVDCLVQNNDASTQGGGLFTQRSKVGDCVLIDNTASLGGAIYAGNSWPVEGSWVTGCTMTDNYAGGAGGAVYLSGENLVDRCVIQGNVSDGDGGALAVGIAQGRPVVSGTVLTGNWAVRGGAVALLGGDSLRVENCTVSANRAPRGGAFYVPPIVGGPATIDVYASILRYNCGDVGGPLVYFGDNTGTLELTCCAVDPGEYNGPGTINAVGPQVTADPQWCQFLGCTVGGVVGGEWGLLGSSPCLPGNSPCGVLIGALGLGCPTSGLPEDPVSTIALRAAPNPFTGDVRIRVAPELAGPGPLIVEVFDIAGRLVRTLNVPDASQPVVWDGRDAKGEITAPGVYFARGSTARWSAVTRVVRLR